MCGAYMVHSESISLGCVCPECLNRCKDCLGTNTLISKEELQKLKNDPTFAERFGANTFYIRPAGEKEQEAYNEAVPESEMYSD